jgi:pimeloyl-ACP methyl ester carboxylesterase
MPFVQQPGVLLHYVLLEQPRTLPNATDVVLLHGLAANLAFWYWKLAPALASAHRVLLVDLRGHGRSSMPRTGYTPAVLAADLKAQLDSLGMPAVHLIGHSFGGRVALQFACMYPHRVRSITLADVYLQSLQRRTGSARDLWPAHWSRASVGTDVSASESGVAWLESLAKLRLSGTGQSINVLATGPFGGASGLHSAQQWLKLLMETSAREDIASADSWTQRDLAGLRKPTLLVYGERSRALGTAWELGKCWPQAKTQIVPRAGHFFPMTKPESLLNPLAAFLRDVRVTR